MAVAGGVVVEGGWGVVVRAFRSVRGQCGRSDGVQMAGLDKTRGVTPK